MLAVHGILVRSDDHKWWVVGIPALDIYTQGRTKKDAYAMAKDAIETVAQEAGHKLEVTILPGKGGHFHVGSGDARALIAFMLRRLRTMRGVSVEEAANRLGSKSKTAYARYEQGHCEPTISKLVQLFEAIDPAGVSELLVMN